MKSAPPIIRRTTPTLLAGLIATAALGAGESPAHRGSAHHPAAHHPVAENERPVIVTLHRAEPPRLVDIAVEEVPDFEAAWILGDGPPRRVEDAEALERALDQHGDGEESTERLVVELHFPDHAPDRGQQREQATAPIKGPIEMRYGPERLWQEVPESLLPSRLVDDGRLEVRRRSGESWRLRLVGDGLGSDWIDVGPEQKSVRVLPRPAEDRWIEILGDGDETLSQATATVLGSAGEPILAQVVALDDGRLPFPALPRDVDFGLVVNASGHASRTLITDSSQLPERLTLDIGGAVQGRFVNADGAPLEGVEVRAETWIDGRLAVLATRVAGSEHDGSFHLDGLPRGEIALSASAAGLANRAAVVELESAVLDLGDIVLREGIDIAIRVVDDLGEPIPAATLTAEAGRSKRTDHRGSLVLRDQAPRAFELKLEAERHLPARQTLEPPFDDVKVLTMQRAAVLTGRVLRQDGAAAGGARVRVERGASYRQVDIEAGGDFEVSVEPRKSHRLVFSSADSAQLRLDVRPLEPGLVRDLGELRLERGLRLGGRILAGESGLPIAGARIWAPRPDTELVTAGWLRGDELRSTSDAEGYFELRGASRLPPLLRIEAPSYARRHVELADPAAAAADTEDEPIDLGDIELQPGGTLRILADAEEADGAVARADLLGLWREIDMVTATLFGGEASIENLPSGEVTVTVLAGHELLCEEIVEIAAVEITEVDCRSDARRITGEVRIGERGAGPGVLRWERPLEAAPDGVIVNRVSASGLTRQQVFGGGRPEVLVETDAASFFDTGKIGPGTWQVRWRSADGDIAGPRTVRVLDLDQQHVQVVFDAGTLRGIVVDESGEPVPMARVQELENHGAALTDRNGRFSLGGLDGELARLHARLEERTSEIVAVDLGAAPEDRDVVLTLAERPESKLDIQVLGESGQAAASAYLFIEDDRGTRRLLTADGDGRLQFPLPAPRPEFLRVAATAGGSWVLGDWHAVGEPGGDLTLEIPEGGALVLASESGGIADVESENGWNVASLLRALGQSADVAPDQPALVSGLPPGRYSVALAGRATVATIEPGEQAELFFD